MTVDLDEVRRRYTAEEVPACRLCGAALSVQQMGGGEPTQWACSDRPRDGDTDAWYDHFRRSYWTQYRHGDPDVLALVDEVADLRALFDLQWTRMGEATARWRAEDPDARALVMPDLGDLLQWLMGEQDRQRDELRTELAATQEWQNGLTAHIPEVYEASEGSQESIIDTWAADAARVVGLAKRWYHGDPEATAALAEAVRRLPDMDDEDAPKPAEPAFYREASNRHGLVWQHTCGRVESFDRPRAGAPCHDCGYDPTGDEAAGWQPLYVRGPGGAR